MEAPATFRTLGIPFLLVAGLLIACEAIDGHGIRRTGDALAVSLELTTRFN